MSSRYQATGVINPGVNGSVRVIEPRFFSAEYNGSIAAPGTPKAQPCPPSPENVRQHRLPAFLPFHIPA
jgi:hypothetical protein